MAVLDDDFSIGATLTDGGDGLWSPPGSTPAVTPRDFQSLYEQQQARAEAAEARCEELRWAEVAARSDAGAWKSRFKSCRQRLTEAEEEAKELRDAARDVPSLRAQVARLQALLSEACARSNEGALVEALSKEVTRLQDALAASPPRRGGAGRQSAGEARRARTALEEAPQRRETIKTLRKEITRLSREVGRGNRAILDFHKKLDKEKERAESIRETAKMLSRENLSLHREKRILGEQAAKVRAMSDESYRLRFALEGAEFANKKLTARIAKLRAAGATLTKLPFDEAAHLRNVLRRSRWQKAAIKSLSRENARLRKAAKSARTGRERAEARLREAPVKVSRRRIEALEAQLAKLRATGAMLSNRLYGRKSEQQEKPRSERTRGQQPGAPGHGRTQRPGLEERREEINPPPDACACARCGQPYTPNGAEESTLVEIDVKAHKRVVNRPRWRRSCECPSSPVEVTAPPVPRLFPRTPYGISFWARFLFEHCACFRPVHRVAAWFSGHGAAGLAGDARRQPASASYGAVRAAVSRRSSRTRTSRRFAMPTRPAGASRSFAETTGRAGPGCGRLGQQPTRLCFRIDRFAQRRSGAHKLFAGALPPIRSSSCDRYSAYKTAGEPSRGAWSSSAFCWSHVRRDFIDCARPAR